MVELVDLGRVRALQSLDDVIQVRRMKIGTAEQGVQAQAIRTSEQQTGADEGLGFNELFNYYGLER